MDIILLTDIAGLGYKNDVVTVKAGYGRNYLLPQGYAVSASSSNRKIMEENNRQISHKAEKIKTAAEDLAKAIGDLTLKVPAVVGESSKIFGRVTSTQISSALKDKGFDIDRKRITLEDIKSLGTYDATIDLHKDVKHIVKVEVVATD